MQHTSSDDITLGILAGGQASRLGGVDKAWLERDGVPQVLRLAERFRAQVAASLVSANRNQARYAEAGLQVVADRHAGIGPIGGLDALAQACTTPWLLTLPVDLVNTNDCLLPRLLAAGEAGACVEDDDGVQPLIALWPVAALRQACMAAIADGRHAVHALQQALGMSRLRLAGLCLGNINTPEDAEAAGIVLPARKEASFP